MRVWVRTLRVRHAGTPGVVVTIPMFSTEESERDQKRVTQGCCWSLRAVVGQCPRAKAEMSAYVPACEILLQHVDDLGVVVRHDMVTR